MADVCLDYSYEFPADAQGLVDDGASPRIAFSFEGADGNAAGSAKFVTTALAFADPSGYRSETATQATGPTWEDLGVPAGATVHTARIVDVDVRVSSTNESNRQFNFDFVDNSGVTVLASLLLGTGTIPNTYTTWTNIAISSLANVNGGSQPSNSPVRLKVGYTSGVTPIVTPVSGDIRIDNIHFEICYEPPPPPIPPSIDICCTHPGKHIAYRLDTDVIVISSFDEGATWTPVLVTTDACDCSNPTIAADHRDNLYVAWHTDDPNVEISISRDYGRTWALWKTVTGASWPRTSFNGRHAHLAFWAAGSIDIYRSLDSLATLQLVASFAVSDEQLCDLGASKDGPGGDRRGMHRVIYSDSGSVKQRLSTDGITWGAAVTLTSGDLPVFVHYEAFGIVIWWVGDVPYIQGVSQDYVTGIGSPALVTTGIPRQYLGLTVDRRDYPWLVYVYFPPTFPSDPPVVFWQPQHGVSPPEGQFDIGTTPEQYGFQVAPATGQFDAIEP